MPKAKLNDKIDESNTDFQIREKFKLFHVQSNRIDNIS